MIFVGFFLEDLGQSLKDIVTNGLDERKNYPVRLSHFMPCTKFLDGVDSSNGDWYWEDSPRVTRLKCLALATATPIVQAISTLLNLANRIAKLVSFAHFWHPSQEQYCLRERAWSFGKDLLRVAFSPIIYVGLELSALYGLILPNNGQKLYATFERAAFGKAVLAPCFQPHPTRHLFRGKPGEINGW